MNNARHIPHHTLRELVAYSQTLSRKTNPELIKAKKNLELMTDVIIHLTEDCEHLALMLKQTAKMQGDMDRCKNLETTLQYYDDSLDMLIEERGRGK